MKTPRQMSEERIALAEEYSRYSGQLAHLIKIHAEYFNLHRQEYKSDNATEKAWDATPEGIQMTILKMKLKSIEKTMSALKTHMELLNNEARGLY